MLLLWHALRYRLCLWRSRYVWLGSVTCSLILVVALLWPTSLSASGRSVSGLSASERSVSERSVFGPPTPLVGWQPAASLQKAQQLNKQGQQAFNQGLSEMALAYWQQAEQQYREAADDLGVLGTQLNQGKALLELGFYRRADGLLQPLVERLEAAPTSLLKVNVWLTFGKKERLLGHLSTAKTYLSAGLVMSQALGDRAHQQAAHLYLGNALTAEQQWPAAMAEYQLAASIAGPLQLSSQLHQLQLLPALGQARQLASQVQAFVLQLEHTASVADDAMLKRTRTYLMLDLSRWLMQYSPETFAELTEAPAAFFLGRLSKAEPKETVGLKPTVGAIGGIGLSSKRSGSAPRKKRKRRWLYRRGCRPMSWCISGSGSRAELREHKGTVFRRSRLTQLLMNRSNR